jgi:hypothetical protein
MFMPFWTINQPSRITNGRNANLAAVERGFLREAGGVPDLSATEEQGGEPPTSRWKGLFSAETWSTSRSVAPLQTIHLAGTIDGRRVEAAVAIGLGTQFVITTVDWFAPVRRPSPGPLGVEKPRFRGARFVADNPDLAERLNAAPGLRRLLGRNLRSSHRIMNSTIRVVPGFQLAPAEGGSMLWVRTTLRDAWWSLGMAHELGVRDFAAFARALESAL